MGFNCRRLPEFGIWLGMKDRCQSPKNASYKNYGGRGIRVCDRWQRSFFAFYKDIGPRPSTKHSIDRFPDNNGGYEPGNCRWATIIEQANNRRGNVLIEFGAEKLTVAQFSRVTNIPYSRALVMARTPKPSAALAAIREEHFPSPVRIPLDRDDVFVVEDSYGDYTFQIDFGSIAEAGGLTHAN